MPLITQLIIYLDLVIDLQLTLYIIIGNIYTRPTPATHPIRLMNKEIDENYKETIRITKKQDTLIHTQLVSEGFIVFSI